MVLSDVFLNLGEDRFSQLLRGISIGKLRTYQLFERLKFRFHMVKLNTENLRKSAPRFWERLKTNDNEFATDLSQAVLVSHLDLIVAVLDFLGIRHEDGFFVKDLDPTPYLTEGWEARVYDNFKGRFPESILLFYINHLGLELGKAERPFIPAAA